jgi:hypothetical protein
MKLLVFTPCNSALQDPILGSSLIAIFHGITFKVPPGTELPSNAVIPKDWAIFSKWGLEPEEYGKEYTSKIEIYWPDGTEFVKASLVSQQPTRDGMAFISRMTGFPVGQDGEIRVVQLLESGGEIIYGPTELIIKVNDPAFIATINQGEVNEDSAKVT